MFQATLHHCPSKHTLQSSRTTGNPHIGLDLGAEGIGVPLQDGFHGRLPGGLVPAVVAAVDAVAAVTVPPAGKALAVPAHQVTWHSVKPLPTPKRDQPVGTAGCRVNGGQHNELQALQWHQQKHSDSGLQLEAARVLAVAVLLGHGRADGAPATGAAAPPASHSMNAVRCAFMVVYSRAPEGAVVSACGEAGKGGGMQQHLPSRHPVTSQLSLPCHRIHQWTMYPSD